LIHSSETGGKLLSRRFATSSAKKLSITTCGNGDADNGGHGACMVHNPNYDFEDRNIPVGAAFWVALTERFLT
jgi:metal-dependent amidase/aminoacylase/carboxypeptidase family protein